MIEKSTAREQEVLKRLVESNKFLYTGKVLMGLTYQRKPPQMTRDEEVIQALLLSRSK
jgi:hypothetical protein